VDSAPGVDFAAQAAWAAVRPGAPCPPMRPLMGPPLREMLRRALPGVKELVIVALERSFRAAYDSEGWMKTTPFPGVKEALTDLKRRKVSCLGVTNKLGLPTRNILAHCGMDQFFEAFVSPDSRQPVFASKTEATLSLLELEEISPATACFVGDTMEDARAAQECGLWFAAYAGGYGWEEIQAQMPGVPRFEHFSGLVSLLEDRGGRLKC